MMPADLPVAWRARAAELEPYAPAAATAFQRAAEELEGAIRAAAAEPLTLAKGAAESGYSPERLRHMVAAGEIPNAGRRGAPRIRRGDLPRKPQAGGQTFDPAAAACRVLNGKLGHG